MPIRAQINDYIRYTQNTVFSQYFATLLLSNIMNHFKVSFEHCKTIQCWVTLKFRGAYFWMTDTRSKVVVLKGLNYSMKKPQRFLAFVIMSHISCEDTLLTMYLYLLYKTKIWVRGTKKD